MSCSRHRDIMRPPTPRRCVEGLGAQQAQKAPGHLGPSYTQKRRCREKQPRGDALVGMVQKSPRGEGNTSPEIRLPRPGGSLRCSGGPACAGRTAARPPRSPPAAGELILLHTILSGSVQIRETQRTILQPCLLKPVPSSPFL